MDVIMVDAVFLANRETLLGPRQVVESHDRKRPEGTWSIKEAEEENGKKKKKEKLSTSAQNQEYLEFLGHIRRKEGFENVTLTWHNEGKRCKESVVALLEPELKIQERS